MDDKDRIVKVSVAKAEAGIGVIFGWAVVCRKDGQDYVDDQDDFVTEKAMLNASVAFMESNRVGKTSHTGPQSGTIVFGMPLTEEIAKSLGISCAKSGLVVGFKPSDPGVLAKFADGTYNGFSIGGWVKEARTD